MASLIISSSNKCADLNRSNHLFLSRTIISLFIPGRNDVGLLGIMESAVNSAKLNTSGVFSRYKTEAAFTPSILPP